MSRTQLVVGAGPVGTAVALHLAETGVAVRLLTRSGSGPDHPGVRRVVGDATDPAVLDCQLEGVDALHLCVHAPYDSRVWRRVLLPLEQVVMDAALRAGVVVVFPESLYAYGEVDGPITEASPRDATVGKLGVRAELLRARAAHPARTVSIAASDFVGPRVRTAHAGERLVPAVLDGRPVRVVGALDVPHSWTSVTDLAAAMVAAAADPATWDAVWHAPTAPPVTQRELVTGLARAAGVPVPRLGTLPVGLMRALGVVSRMSYELAETGYQLKRPFVLDSTLSEQRLGLAPTPWEQTLADTVAWWRAERGEVAPTAQSVRGQSV